MTYREMITQEDIQLILNQNPKALLKLYSLLMPKLKPFFNTRINDSRDGEELIQDTFLSILDSLPQFNGKSQFLTWCMAIAKHELIDYYRRRKIKTLLFSHFPFLKHIVDKALGPQLALEEKEAKHKIYQTLTNLSEGYELVLRLRYMEGKSVAEIAQMLNISYKAAESKLSRARLAFQKAFVHERSLVQTNSQIFNSS